MSGANYKDYTSRHLEWQDKIEEDVYLCKNIQKRCYYRKIADTSICGRVLLTENPLIRIVDNREGYYRELDFLEKRTQETLWNIMEHIL